jgi:hypothetical protein
MSKAGELLYFVQSLLIILSILAGTGHVTKYLVYYTLDVNDLQKANSQKKHP